MDTYEEKKSVSKYLPGGTALLSIEISAKYLHSFIARYK